MFRDRTEPTLFRAGTVLETVPVRSLLFEVREVHYDWSLLRCDFLQYLS